MAVSVCVSHYEATTREVGLQLTFGVVGDGQVPGGGWVTGVGRTRCVAGVEPTRGGLARIRECRLRDGVIGVWGVEDEGDDGAVGGGHGVGSEQKALVSVPVVPDVNLGRKEIGVSTRFGWMERGVGLPTPTVWSWARTAVASASADTEAE